MATSYSKKKTPEYGPPAPTAGQPLDGGGQVGDTPLPGQAHQGINQGRAATEHQRLLDLLQHGKAPLTEAQHARLRQLRTTGGGPNPQGPPGGPISRPPGEPPPFGGPPPGEQQAAAAATASIPSPTSQIAPVQPGGGGGGNRGAGGGQHAPTHGRGRGGQGGIPRPPTPVVPAGGGGQGGPGPPPPDGGGTGAPPPTGTPGALPPPQSPQTEMERQNAWAAWNNQQSQNQQALYAAALRYGDPNLIKRYGADVGAPPMGALEQIQRAHDLGITANNEARNNQNLFFSGRHIKDVGNINDETSFQNADALQNYTSASQRLANLLANAMTTRDQALSQADLEDIQAAEQTPPAPKDTNFVPTKKLQKRVTKLQGKRKKAQKHDNTKRVQKLSHKIHRTKRKIEAEQRSTP